MRITTNFTKKEFTDSRTAIKHNINNSPNTTQTTNIIKLAFFLQHLRNSLCNYYNREVYIQISSGFRSKKLNRILGGARNSAHLRGLAVDITATGITPYELAIFIKSSKLSKEVDQCILEFNSWVHLALPDKAAPRQQFLEAYKEKNMIGLLKTKYKALKRK